MLRAGALVRCMWSATWEALAAHVGSVVGSYVGRTALFDGQFQAPPATRTCLSLHGDHHHAHGRFPVGRLGTLS